MTMTTCVSFGTSSVIGTGPEPAKPAGLTSSQGQPVRFSKKICKTGLWTKPASEPAGSEAGLVQRPVLQI